MLPCHDMVCGLLLQGAGAEVLCSAAGHAEETTDAPSSPAYLCKLPPLLAYTGHTPQSVWAQVAEDGVHELICKHPLNQGQISLQQQHACTCVRRQLQTAAKRPLLLQPVGCSRSSCMLVAFTCANVSIQGVDNMTRGSSIAVDAAAAAAAA